MTSIRHTPVRDPGHGETQMFVRGVWSHGHGRWFDKTLRRCSGRCAQPRRVDRIEHNDDIDDRIYAEIEAADLRSPI